MIETTTRKRIVPEPASSDNPTPEFFQYVRDIKPNDWSNHMVYLYRVEPKPSVPLLRSGNSFLSMPGGQGVQIADQEELEFALAQNFGGGVFRLIVKRGSQWVSQVRLEINAPVRAINIPAPESQPGSNPGAPMLGTGSDGATASIASKAIDTIAGQEHQAVLIGVNALNAAANVVRQFSEGRPASSPQDATMQQFMQVMIARALQDPFEQMVKFMSLMREMNNAAGGNVAGLPGDMMQQFMKAMFEKFMNPTPTGAPTSASAELMRQLPQIGQSIAESLREFRHAREAEARMVAMTRGNPVVQPPSLPSPTALPPAATSAATPSATPQPAGAPSMEFVEQKIMEIFKQPISAKQAADEAMAFLDNLDPNAIGQLAALGEDGLLKFFATRPALKLATANMPRLVEFIRAFLQMHAEDLSQAGDAPPAPSHPLPN